jgi:hypothetical protein
MPAWGFHCNNAQVCGGALFFDTAFMGSAADIEQEMDISVLSEQRHLGSYQSPPDCFRDVIAALKLK